VTVHGGDLSLACAWALVDELTRGGVRHACLSPGSRSTALVLALSRHPSIELHIHLDERSSAFVALGLAKADRRPVIVACTSGTAATEFFPAVVEASQSRVPLVLLTADRPPRLRGTGANQTIDQIELYGEYADFVEVPSPASPADAETWRAAGRDALLGTRRTLHPVHVNCPFDEPLVPSGNDLELPRVAEPFPSPEREERMLAETDDDRLAAEVNGRRGVFVVGPAWPFDATRLSHTAEMLRWPILAEPLSGARRPDEALAAGQSLIGDERWAARHRPEIVVQFGAAPTSRATQAFVASADRAIVADRMHPDPDPERRATWRLRADLDEVLRALGGRHVEQRTTKGKTAIAFSVSEGDPLEPAEIERHMARRLKPAPEGWHESWSRADEAARRALDQTMDAGNEPSGLRVARDLAASIPDRGLLLVGNSTPVRDLDLAMPPCRNLDILGNRGASGIDGLVSTALGVAASGRGPTFALLGDLSFLYDLGAIAWAARHHPPDLVLIVVNNAGGRIFSLLAQDDLPERELFTTPHGADIGKLSLAAGVGHRVVADAEDLAAAVHQASLELGVQVVEVTVDPESDRRTRAEVRAAVASALAPLP
jgi:2-succinyl-5-enolpyruvyl-6-hydroxy-3-cyclohexene-1-carboxylate synthase